MLMDRYSFEDEVEVELQADGLVLHPIKKVRVGWSEAFVQMHKKKDDVLLVDDVFEDETWDD